MTKRFFVSLQSSKALEVIFMTAGKMHTEFAVMSMLEILAVLAEIDFLREYLMLADALKVALEFENETSLLSVSVITLLSRYPLCPRKFLDLGLAESSELPGAGKGLPGERGTFQGLLLVQKQST
jgi:hypothetical protein